eukprot:TRINITY_DN5387_c0_g1_i1.p1 TRINITY_DN5387_c0_g1~~TRINITY_DN5387_c0_g1_i1.p1  ORF type:complete len:445 (-),score=77.90 TRINITY_DN5387_c0_g1_i1:17-1351(-)
MPHKNKSKQKGKPIKDSNILYQQQRKIQAITYLLEGYPHVHHDLFLLFNMHPHPKQFMLNQGATQPCLPEEVRDFIYEIKFSGSAIKPKMPPFSSLRPEEQEIFINKAVEAGHRFEVGATKVYRDYLANPRKISELLIGIFSDCHPRIGGKVYSNAVYILIPLMKQLTEEDCRGVLSNFNCGSFYLDTETREPTVYKLPTEDHPLGNNGIHYLADLFCKMLPLIKLIYQEERVDRKRTYHFKDFLLKNSVKPADSDKPFLVKESNHVWIDDEVEDSQEGLKLAKIKYMKDLQTVCELREWKMMSDEVECNYIACSVVKKYKDLTQLSSEEIDENYTPQEIGHTIGEDNQNNENHQTDEATNEQSNPPTMDKKNEQTDKSKESNDNIQANSSSSTPPMSRDNNYMLRCGKCKARYYCSVECQRKSWIVGHKAFCSHISSASKYKF